MLIDMEQGLKVSGFGGRLPVFWRLFQLIKKEAVWLSV